MSTSTPSASTSASTSASGSGSGSRSTSTHGPTLKAPSNSNAVESFYNALSTRLSCYTLTNTSPISDAAIHEAVSQAIQHAPSSFNSQSTRAVILLKADHERFWDLGDSLVKAAMPAAYPSLAPRVQGFKAAYGTVLWFEDQAALEGLRAKNPGIGHMFADWSQHSSGMHQFIVWTALELQGLGCNLQHYNFMPEMVRQVREIWGLPDTWELNAQLVFGQPVDGLKRARERTYLPLEERVRAFGA